MFCPDHTIQSDTYQKNFPHTHTHKHIPTVHAQKQYPYMHPFCYKLSQCWHRTEEEKHPTMTDLQANTANWLHPNGHVHVHQAHTSQTHTHTHIVWDSSWLWHSYRIVAMCVKANHYIYILRNATQPLEKNQRKHTPDLKIKKAQQQQQEITKHILSNFMWFCNKVSYFKIWTHA